MRLWSLHLNRAPADQCLLPDAVHRCLPAAALLLTGLWAQSAWKWVNGRALLCELQICRMCPASGARGAWQCAAHDAVLCAGAGGCSSLQVVVCQKHKRH